MKMRRSVYALGLLVIGAGIASLSGCTTTPSSGEQAAMTRADSTPPMQAPARQPQEVKTPVGREPQQIRRPVPGPYVRAELGYSNARSANFREDNPSSPDCFLFSAGGGCNSVLDNAGNSAVVAIGIGYRFTPLLRADISYGRRGGYDLKGWDTAGTYFDPQLSSDSLMLSGTVDFPYWIAGRVQPFVGLAVGRSRNKMDALKWFDPGPPASNGVLNAGGSKNSTAWQVTLGANIAVTDKIVVEVGYRYADFGEFRKPAGPDQAGVFTGTGMTSSATGKLRANELFGAIRYDFF